MKTKLRLTTALLMIAGATAGYGQNYDSYQLKDYTLPNIKRSALDLGLGSNGDFATYHKQDGTAYNIEGRFSADFNHRINTRRFISNQDFLVSLGGFQRDGVSDNDVKTSHFEVAGNYANQSQFYFNDPKKWFWQVGGTAQLSYQRDKVEDKSTYFTANIIPKAGIGWGRIEDVTDARQAVYILDKLTSKGIIKKHLSDSEVNELAQVISTVKNKRFLDSRKHMIDEITTVSTYMADKGYTQSEGAEYFTTLYDYWLYGDLHQRLSGLQAGFSVQPGYVHTDPGEDYKINSLLMAAVLEMQYEKPINLYWQHSAELSLGYQYLRTKYEDDYFETAETNSGTLQGSYYLGYYPNSRTHLRAGIMEDLTITDDSYRKRYSATSLNCEAYYYVSPQFRIQGSAQIGYCATDDDYIFADKKWFGNYRITFTYSIF